MKRYKSRVKQYQQNKTFKNNQKALYEELYGKMRQLQVMPDAKESIKFWSGLWDNPVDQEMLNERWQLRQFGVCHRARQY